MQSTNVTRQHLKDAKKVLQILQRKTFRSRNWFQIDGEMKMSSSHEMCKNLSEICQKVEKKFRSSSSSVAVFPLVDSSKTYFHHKREKQEARKYFSLLLWSTNEREKSKFNSYEKIFHVGVASGRAHTHRLSFHTKYFTEIFFTQAGKAFHLQNDSSIQLISLH